MPTPTDPYNSSTPRPFEEDILDPIPEGTSAAEAAAGEAIVPAEMTSEQQAAVEAAAESAAPQVRTAAEVAAEGVPAAAEGPTVVGSLSLDEPQVDVEQAEIPNAFEAAAPAPVADEATGQPAQPTVVEARPEATLADGSAYAAEAAAPAATSAAQAPVRKSVMDNSDVTLDRALEVSPLTASSASDIENPFEAAAPAESAWEPAPDAIEAIPEGPKSRIGAHIGIFFATLLLVPIAWYLLSDASIRLAVLEGNQWETGKVAIPALLEFIGGLILVGLVWFLARASSLGAFIWGLLLTLLGAIGVIMPYFARNTIAAWVSDHISSLSTLTGNIARHFALDLGAGRILIFGFLLLMTSIVSHYARKRGNLAGIQTTRREVALGK